MLKWYKTVFRWLLTIFYEKGSLSDPQKQSILMLIQKPVKTIQLYEMLNKTVDYEIATKAIANWLKYVLHSTMFSMLL